MKLRIVFISGVLLSATTAFALNSGFYFCERMLEQKARAPKAFSLFDRGKPVKNYNDLVRDIRAGDDLKFEDGSVFHVKRRFGAGMTTLLLDIGEGELLRIPLYVTTHPLDQNPLPFIQDFIEIQPELVANGVPVVTMVAKKTIAGQAVVVKEEPLEFSLEDFLNKRDGDNRKLKLSKAERKLIEKKLIEFARKTWMYERMGDFRTSELGYNGNEWIIFDVGDDRYPHLLIDSLKSKKTIFDPYSKFEEGTSNMVPDPQLPDDLFEKVKDAIREERKKQRETPEIFEQIKKRGAYSREK